MLRAAAKNFPFVAVVVDPSDYPWVSGQLTGEGLSLEGRRSLAAKAFRHVSMYDTAVAGFLSGATPESDGLPATLAISLTKVAELRYGENPHQRGGMYAPEGAPAGGIAQARQLHGQELSFNNLMDADAAWRIVCDFAEPSVAVIKHANPCGLASDEDQVRAYQRAYEGDSV